MPDRRAIYRADLPLDRKAQRDRVLGVLRRGKGQALSVHAIATRAEIDGGRAGANVRILVRELVDAGHLIGSGSQGFWLIAGRDEFADVVAGLESRRNSLDERISALTDAWRRREAQTAPTLPGIGSDLRKSLALRGDK